MGTYARIGTGVRRPEIANRERAHGATLTPWVFRRQQRRPATAVDLARCQNLARHTFQRRARFRESCTFHQSTPGTPNLSNGALGSVQGTRLATGHLNDLSLSLYGTKGALSIFTNGRMSSLKGCIGTDLAENRWQEIDCPPVPSIYRRFVDAIRSGSGGEPDFRRGAEIQRLIDVALAKGQAR